MGTVGLMMDLMMIKSCALHFGPCKDLLDRPTSLEDTDVHPFEEIPEDEFLFRSCRRTSIGPK